jgi:hypothetical protein
MECVIFFHSRNVTTCELNGNPDGHSVVPNGRAHETTPDISRDILRIRKTVFDSCNDAGFILSVGEISIS